MKLVIREYLASIRERGELDAILPDLLTEMGLTVYARPAVGTRQFGVDIAAVGPDKDGINHHWLFSVKAGNIDRTSWNGAGPQSLRPSLDEILDVYLRSHVPVQFADLPVIICLCFGGDVHQQVRADVNGYQERYTTGRVRFEEWNGDRLADAILEGVLREEVLPPNLRSHLRKAVAMVEQPEIAIGHFQKLLKELHNQPVDQSALRLSRARLINICLWVLFIWARESGNVEAPYRASELAILSLWDLLHNDIGSNRRLGENAGLIFQALIELHFVIWDEYIEKKILPFVEDRHAISTAVGSFASLDVNLKMFDLIGRLAIRGLWLCWQISLQRPLPSVFEGECKDKPVPILMADYNVNLGKIDRICRKLVYLVTNNRALVTPIADWQTTDIALAVTLLASRPAFHPVTCDWLKTMGWSVAFAYQTHGLYPTTAYDYAELAEHPIERSDTYREEATAGSTLLPFLALWMTAFGDKESLNELARFKLEALGHCTFQTWFPDEDSEGRLYLGGGVHGAALTDIPVLADTDRTMEFILDEIRANPWFDKLSAISSGHWPVLLVACRVHRLPVPPSLWRDLLPTLAALRPVGAIPSDLSSEC